MKASWILGTTISFLTCVAMADASFESEVTKYARILDCSTKQAVTIPRVQVLRRIQRTGEASDVASQCLLVTGANIGICKIEENDSGVLDIISPQFTGGMIKEILVSSDGKVLDFVGYAKYECVPY